MAGNATNGLPLVEAPLLNTTTVDPSAGGLYTNPTSTALVAVDTGLSSGGAPQSVAMTIFQIAALAGPFITNTATSTVHAATLNTRNGRILTEALTTAAGATYQFDLTNSLLTTSTAAPQVVVFSGTNTAGAFQIVSVVNVSGGATIIIKNSGTAAWNGTINIMFHV